MSKKKPKKTVPSTDCTLSELAKKVKADKSFPEEHVRYFVSRHRAPGISAEQCVKLATDYAARLIETREMGDLHPDDPVSLSADAERIEAEAVEAADSARDAFLGKLGDAEGDSAAEARDAYDTHGCTRQAYVRTGARPAVVAHELGHMMGLEHVDDPRNLMHPDAPTDHVGLTSEQRRTSKRARAVITACEAIQ